MASIVGSRDVSIFKITKWLGINENPDGDTKLRPGEAAELRNFKITLDGNLQIRPGTKTLFQFDGPVRGLWSGNVGGTLRTVCTAEGRLWSVDLETCERAIIGTLTDAPTEFFGYSQRLYILNGCEYLVWDGTGEALAVEGYRPLVSAANPPEGGGMLLESVNMLTGARRARYSPDGTAQTFSLPERNLQSVDYVTDIVTGMELEGYTVNLSEGTVTFAAAPAQGVSSVEIGWTYPENDRSVIKGMRFSEFYSGKTDIRVFLYGDGSNMAVYSGLDYDGNPTAEYFPDMNVLHAGEANTPITGMIRHFTTMLIFKENSAFIANYGAMTLADESVTAAFNVLPVNRDIGNAAPGQVRLVVNNPYTLFGASVYEWQSGGGSITLDERNARRVSGRVAATLRKFDFSSCVSFDDEEKQEYYIVCGDKAVIHNYAADAWYIYTGFPAACFLSLCGEMYIGTDSGQIRHVSRAYQNDDGEAIDAYWRSGSLAFERDWQQKCAAKLFVTVKPEARAQVRVTVETNRQSGHTEKTVQYGLSTFSNVSFAHWSFGTNRKPQTEPLKIKAKKFAYYQLIFKSCADWSAATILAADIKVRYTGDVK